MNKNKQELLKQLPSVDSILKIYEKANENEEIDIHLKKAIRNTLDTVRHNILNEKLNNLPSDQQWLELIKEATIKERELSLRGVINGTGTILHTNLGRSVMSSVIKENLDEIAFGYSNLEYDLAKGTRGSRYSHIENILKELTGAEAALVVNNNAAAVLLALKSLVPNKEVIISRGELVEIGGSFRIPEVIKMGGGTLLEVGTTNKTHLKDYQEVITEETGALMKVHTSNYRIVGFSEEVSNSDLAKLAHQHDIPLINDAGSGILLNLTEYGLPYEPSVKDLISEGADIVTFSGDKLLGGPQAGLIVGKKKYVDMMKQNQLLRALRIDKLTLIALEATLRIYLDEESCFEKIPFLKMLSLSLDECKAKALELKTMLDSSIFNIELVNGQSEIGGGSYPERELPTYLLRITSEKYSPQDIERLLRTGKIPIIGRIQKDAFVLDVRTINNDEFIKVKEALMAIN